MKLYIAKATCSLAVQIVLNELGMDNTELVHYDVFGKSTSNGEDFAQVNPLGYVPVLRLDDGVQELLAETVVIGSYLADLHPRSGLIPAHGTLERVRVDALLNFVATEIAQKHIPLMRKLLTEEGSSWTRAKLVAAYARLDRMLQDGRPWLTGERFTVLDAYVWATFWHERSGVDIGHLEHLMAYKSRIEARPSVIKALADEAALVLAHETRLAA
ncbi:glutathione S-transferase N-terminal domain-containing protein [Bordetella bronchialis]|uniref:glutathione S-transferase N-terminal domain-containing protein n=1 Tax=Bordetella bronchialis TaxID=463025 RepID=UPI003D018E14